MRIMNAIKIKVKQYKKLYFLYGMKDILVQYMLIKKKLIVQKKDLSAISVKEIFSA